MEPGAPHPYGADDIALQGEFFAPTAPSDGRAVLVVHEADGIGGNVRRHCHRLAARGYSVLAADMHGAGRPLEGAAMQAALDRFRAQSDLVRGRVAAGLAALRAATGIDTSRCAAIGFCFGGFAVLELARAGSDVAAVASFHGLLTTARPATPGSVRARVAAFTGARDPLVPPADVAAFAAEMIVAEADWQLHAYGNARHGFTNAAVDGLGDPRMAYDARAHRQSWNTLLAFLDESLGTHSPTCR
jgi:dienelactone hydrolase